MPGRDNKEMRMIYLSASVLGFSIMAIIFLAVGLTIIFYVLAVLAIILGFYFARSLPDHRQAQSDTPVAKKSKGKA